MFLLKQRSSLPGFHLALGYTVFYLSLIVLIPLSTLFIKSSSLDWKTFIDIVSAPRTLAAIRLSFSTAFVAASVNVFFGFMIAWVLARYRFPGKKIIDALIDFPFALPTAVAGIALTALYSPHGWVGRYLYSWGIESAYSPLGITLALIFIGLPFVVRTIEPVIQELDPELEEAAASLGAGRWQTFGRVLFPVLLPPLLTGFNLAFARGIAEYGSIIFIAGNMPGKTEIAPLLIITKLEQFDYTGATAIAVVMLTISFILLAITNFLQWWASKRIGIN
ncbi:MAG TPA: sulfate ABC transporter permease subunit CysT [Candidatus Omnitrophica bacterium]|nr:MAG: sulfate ABC transporter permease subunit CysT [Omnitrophica WOR_2 bacterium GWA2_45_18]HBR14145.1 sulfate ABC transporter permease subunit CysT [Candidatus Omnitrophota bacterium]